MAESISKHEIPLEYIGKVEIPHTIGNIERIIAGSKIPIADLDSKYRESYHKQEPEGNSTGNFGFLDFVQRVRTSADLFYTVVYDEYRRGKIFEHMLKYFLGICKERGIIGVYAAVDKVNEPMLNAMRKYSFQRTGTTESLTSFRLGVQDSHLPS